jgi:hypothetical protein
MKIQKFNELYEQNPKDSNWGNDTNDTNYYTFTCDITVRATSQEEAEDKMEFIANQNKDVELGVYNLSYSTENGESKINGLEAEETSNEIAPNNMLESRKYRRPLITKRKK